MGVKLSCIELTAPQVVLVVMAAKRGRVEDAEADLFAFHIARRRIEAELRECAGFHGPPPLQQMRIPTTRTMNIDAHTAHPCAWFFTIRPR